MPNARGQFIRSFRSLRHAAADVALVDRAASQRRHNSKAAILRNGLTVIAFATVEHFLRSRSAELLKYLGRTGPRFSRLSDHLRTEATTGVLEAVRYQAGLAGKRGDDVPAFIVSELRAFAKYRTAHPFFTGRHFGVGKANLGREDVPRLLRIFAVQNGWAQVTDCSQRLGAPLLGPENIFHAAAHRRHTAAHDPRSVVTSIDLQTFVEQSLVLGCSFDIIATHAILSFARRLQPNRTMTAFEQADIAIRFIDRGNDNVYRELAENARRAAATNTLLEPLLANARARAQGRNETLVIRGRGLRLRNWITPL